MRDHRRHPRGRALRFASILFFSLAGLAGTPAAQSSRVVDLELVLAIDCSYSVDAGEFELQKIGLAEAFINPAVLAAILAGEHKAIGVTVVEWSVAGAQTVVVPWTTVHDVAAAVATAEHRARFQKSRSGADCRGWSHSILARTTCSRTSVSVAMLRDPPYFAD